MKTQIELIKYYEKRLEKVKRMHPVLESNTNTQNEKSQAYIDDAAEQLEAVKNGRSW